MAETVDQTGLTWTELVDSSELDQAEFPWENISNLSSFINI